MSVTSIVLTVFVVCLLLGVPLGFTMVGAAITGFILSPKIAPITFAVKILTSFESFALLAIPLFMLAGQLMTDGGITKKILDFANSFLGHLTGGLGYAATFTGVVMAGISGSANADSAAIGAVMVPAMTENGYGEEYSVCLVATAGVLGPIIPPSIIMIVYSGCTGISIAALFASGILPGFLVAFMMCVYNYIYAKKAKVPKLPKQPAKVIWKSFITAIPALIMPLIIVGGVIFGIFTSTESGGIAVAYGLIYCIVTRSLDVKKTFKACCDASIASSGPVFILMASNCATYIFTRLNIAAIVTNWMISLTDDYYMMLFLIVIIVVVLGMLIEVSSAMLMAVPIFITLIPIFGYDPLYFAAVIVMTFAAGGLTPPVGIVLYIVAGIKNTPLAKCMIHVLPFVAMILIMVIIGIYVPDLFLFVPRILGLWA